VDSTVSDYIRIEILDMKTILVIGAGRSSSSLIKYLLNHAPSEHWNIRVGDMDLPLAQAKVAGYTNAEAFQFNALDPAQRRTEVSRADLIISMLPAFMHLEVVKDCIALKKDVLTPSYVTPEMKKLHDDAVAAGITIMNEIGVDPGLDHLSARDVLDRIIAMGGEIKTFESFTGGLIAPESDNNPWNYKFTWNPRNVVLAGQGGAAKFIQEGKYKYIPYHQLFRRTEIIEIDGYGSFEGYANRDSLKYREVYGLEDIPTIYRGTLRRVGFSRAWDILVKLGMTDDSYVMEGSENMTYRDFTNSFLAYDEHNTVELKLRHYMKIDYDDTIWERLVWLGLFDGTKKVGLKDATPAQILQKILEEKWSLAPTDKDMIVMWHKFEYVLHGKFNELHSSMVYIGKDQTYTAMSDTVGIPAAIMAKRMVKGLVPHKGVQLPLHKDIYEPILKELETFGMVFHEKQVR
jgi:saccharopine dehydrogenase-like NADP-dependent oxidoreductase